VEVWGGWGAPNIQLTGPAGAGYCHTGKAYPPARSGAAAGSATEKDVCGG